MLKFDLLTTFSDSYLYVVHNIKSQLRDAVSGANAGAIERRFIKQYSVRENMAKTGLFEEPKKFTELWCPLYRPFRPF